MCRRAVLTIAVAILLSSLSASWPSGNAVRGQDPAFDRQGNPLPAGAVARFGGMHFRHGDRIMTLAFSPDGKRVISGGVDDGTLRLWDADTGKPIRAFRGPTLNFRSVALSADGKTLVASPLRHFYDGGWLIAWDVASGKEIADLRQPPEYRKADYAAYTDGNLVLARVSEPRTFHLWRSATGKEMSFPGLGNDTGWLVFSADASVLACAVGKEIRLWDVATGKEVRRCTLAEAIRPDFALSPGGKRLAEVTRESTVRLWDTATGLPVRELKLDRGSVVQTAFSPDGKTLAVGTYEGLLRFLELATGKERTTVAGHEAAVCSVALSADGKKLVTASFDRTVRLWDTATAKERHCWQAHHLGYACVALSPDGKQVAAAGRKPDSAADEGVFHLWDAASGRDVRPAWHEKGWGMAVAFSPNGKTLAAGSADGTLRLLDAATGDEQRRCKDPSGGYDPGVRALAFSQDGRLLASAAVGGTLSLWETATADRRAHAVQIEPPPHPHSAGAFRLTTRGVRPLRPGRLAMIEALAFAPDGKTLFTGGGVRLANARKASWTIRRWDTEALEEVGRFIAHPSHVYGLALSPDGKLLATGHEDGVIVLWDAASGRKRGVLTGHSGAVLALAFATDGKTVASAGKDGTALLWNVTRVLQAPPPAATVTADELEKLWGQLREGDARFAQRALRQLTATPRPTVAFLKERLRPVPPADPKQLAALIADLDRNEFARRDRAIAALEKLEHLAAPALREALTGKISLEFRRRVELLLEKLKRWTPERLGQLRALEVLERIGSPDARRVLEAMAQGAPASPSTQEAREAVERLARQVPVSP